MKGLGVWVKVEVGVLPPLSRSPFLCHVDSKSTILSCVSIPAASSCFCPPGYLFVRPPSMHTFVHVVCGQGLVFYKLALTGSDRDCVESDEGAARALSHS